MDIQRKWLCKYLGTAFIKNKGRESHSVTCSPSKNDKSNSCQFPKLQRKTSYEEGIELISSFCASAGKESICNAEWPRFDPSVGKIPWRREWQPTPVFLAGESHGQRSLVGYSSWGRKELDITEQLALSHSLFGQRTDIWQVSQHSFVYRSYICKVVFRVFSPLRKKLVVSVYTSMPFMFKCFSSEYKS